MTYRLRTDDWASLGPAAGALRYQVFVLEQQVPEELELDEMDRFCLHALAEDEGGHALGTGRLLPDGHIGRMAVAAAARGQGIGSAILLALMAAARQRGDPCVVLHAQAHAAGFYRRHGYVAEGEPFMEAGIPHLQMRHVFPADGE